MMHAAVHGNNFCKRAPVRQIRSRETSFLTKSSTSSDHRMRSPQHIINKKKKCLSGAKITSRRTSVIVDYQTRGAHRAFHFRHQRQEY